MKFSRHQKLARLPLWRKVDASNLMKERDVSDTKFKAVLGVLNLLDFSEKPSYTDEQEQRLDAAFERLNDFRKSELPPDVETDSVS
jgi:hypothetical protein